VVGDSDECILEIRFSGDDVANQLQKVEEDELETLVRMLPVDGERGRVTLEVGLVANLLSMFDRETTFDADLCRPLL